ncbi:type II secretion system F family protein [Leucobacter albus]|uniref:Type II secretion system F family protein n=1 Tax=Leucobacter albus TaxID=272210 RepID=A0ABW3TMN7_9MICO
MASRCAALLRSGMSPERMVAALAADIELPETAALAERVRSGQSVAAAFGALDGPEWRLLSAAWRLATHSGAPFAPALDRIALALRGISDVARRREVLLAGPRSTARLVAWLPLAAVAVGFLLGFDPLPVFLTPIGAALLAGGIGLQLVGVRWTHALAARVERRDHVAGLECELMWIALAGGSPPGPALRSVADAVSQGAVEWVPMEALRRGEPLANALATAVAAGAPAAALLLDTATELRGHARAQIEQEAERLGVRILVPLACCVLPAFVAMGVVPVLVTLLGDVLLG